jgi:rRNA maturation endonuclease Nob1
MGTELTGHCKCGYEDKVYIGSGRALHGKVFDFPYHCKSCRTLISIDKLSDDISCKICGSADVVSYESETKTLGVYSFFNRFSSELLRFFGYHKQDVVFHESFCYRLNKSFVIMHGDQYCPRCGESNLKFYVSALYD